MNPPLPPPSPSDHLSPRSHHAGGGGGGDPLPPRSQRSNGGQLDARGILTEDQIALVLADLATDEQATLLGAGLGRGTWSRYLVEKYFSKYRWYNPHRDDPAAPSLSKGWAYFEHFTLPRRFDRVSGGHDIRAPPGEVAKRTRLYRVFGTTQESLSDWGIGMGMYFSSLTATFIIFVLAGCLNIVNIVYYASDEYDAREGLTLFNLNLGKMLQYSSVCTGREWVVCAEPDGVAATCRNNSQGALFGGSNYWDNSFTKEYYGTAKGTNGEDVTLIHRTTCRPAEFEQGMINYGTVLMLVLAMAFFIWWLRKKEVRFDEDNSSAPDYSLVIHNPPPDAIDPDEWRDFFEVFAEKHVTLVTVALNNEQLLTKLVKRRKDIRTLGRCLPLGTKVDTDDIKAMDTVVEKSNRDREEKEAQRNCLVKLLSCPVAPVLRCLGKGLSETVLWERIKATTEEIREFQKKEYKATAVYVTFETEQGQRTALEALNASEIEVITNRPLHHDASALFRGRVLRAVEATEPNAVRWMDLDYFRLSIYLRQLITLGITCLLVMLSAVVLLLSRIRASTLVFSIILSSFNLIIPKIVKLIVSFERHYCEGDVQKSLYVKVTFFRWMNTAIITRVITPVLATIGEKKIDLINTISALMISEMFLSPLLRYLDFASILKRHFLAPRAKTEEEMFNCFNGGMYNIAEFTDYTKVLLLCTFYSAFYPLIYFLGAGILFLQYWMDKFLLLRSWKRTARIGPETSRFSRFYFNSLAILLGVISSAYAYAKSPYTQLCNCAENSEEWASNKNCILPEMEFTDVEVVLKNGTVIEVEEISTHPFYFCNQDSNFFPPLPADQQGPDKWMDEGQERLLSIYGWTCVVFLVLYCILVLGQGIVRNLVSLFWGTYEPSGCNQQKDFSNGIGLETFGYVPQLVVSGFNFPLITCNVDDIDVGLIGWSDPNGQEEKEHLNYDKHNLIYDVPHETLHRSRNVAADHGGEKKGRPIFSVIKHYPPEWARQAKTNKQD